MRAFRDWGTGNGEWDWGTDFLSEEKTKSEQRYSGKPDGDSRNAQIKWRVESVGFIVVESVH